MLVTDTVEFCVATEKLGDRAPVDPCKTCAPTTAVEPAEDLSTNSFFPRS